jgi:predicted MFS family arabinose efflux permease
VAILLLFGAHFLAYTFVTPFLLQVSKIGSGAIGALLLAYGVAAFTGNLLGGWASGRSLRGSMLATAVLLGLPMMLLVAAGAHTLPVFLLLMLWGVAFGMLPIAVQSWMFGAAPKQLEAVQALFVSLSQVAIGLGALAGGQLVDHLGVASALWVAALAALATAGYFGLSTSGYSSARAAPTPP